MSERAMIKKTRVISKKKRIAITIIIVILVALLPMTIGIYSANYGAIKQYPTIVEGVFDIEEIGTISPTLGMEITGDYALYYNKWLITDNELARDCDGYISIVDKWTSLERDGKKLPKTGYASYVFILKNVNSDQEFEVHSEQAIAPLRIFVNGKRYYQGGEMSKTELNVGYHGKEIFHENIRFEKDKDYEVVVEVGYTSQGGLSSNMWFSPIGYYNNDNVNMPLFVLQNMFNYVALGMLVATFLISIGIVIVTRGRKINFAMPTFIGALVLFFMWSKDFFSEFSNLAGIDYGRIDVFAFVSTIIATVCFIFYLSSNGIKFKGKDYIFGIVTCVVSTIIYCVGVGYWYRYFAMIVFALLVVPIAYRLSAGYEKNPAFAATSSVMLILLVGVSILQMLNIIGAIHMSINGAPSFVTALFVFLICMVHIMKVRDINKKALASANLELEVKQIKKDALNAQIKPHFLFNMLASIQYMYNNANLEQGNMAMHRFATHLRNNINADVIGIVTFRDELLNIDNYFELENVRHSGKLKLLYDIGFEDFSLPILSLQPFVENAIKHGKTELAEDKFITLSSQLEGDNIIIKIIDNGVGYDTSVKKSTSIGISNCVERLRLDLNASVDITSEIGVGTWIVITIPNDRTLLSRTTQLANEIVKS